MDFAVTVPPLPPCAPAAPGPSTNSARRRHRIGNSELSQPRAPSVCSPPAAPAAGSRPPPSPTADGQAAAAADGAAAPAGAAGAAGAAAADAAGAAGAAGTAGAAGADAAAAGAGAAASDASPRKSQRNESCPSSNARSGSCERQGAPAPLGEGKEAATASANASSSSSGSTTHESTVAAAASGPAPSKSSPREKHSTASRETAARREHVSASSSASLSSDDDIVRPLQRVQRPPGAPAAETPMPGPTGPGPGPVRGGAGRVPPLAIHTAVNLSSLRMGTPRTPHTPQASALGRAALGTLRQLPLGAGSLAVPLPPTPRSGGSGPSSVFRVTTASAGDCFDQDPFRRPNFDRVATYGVTATYSAAPAAAAAAALPVAAYSPTAAAAAIYSAAAVPSFATAYAPVGPPAVLASLGDGNVPGGGVSPSGGPDDGSYFFPGAGAGTMDQVLFLSQQVQQGDPLAHPPQLSPFALSPPASPAASVLMSLGYPGSQFSTATAQPAAQPAGGTLPAAAGAAAGRLNGSGGRQLSPLPAAPAAPYPPARLSAPLFPHVLRPPMNSGGVGDARYLEAGEQVPWRSGPGAASLARPGGTFCGSRSETAPESSGGSAGSEVHFRSCRAEPGPLAQPPPAHRLGGPAAGGASGAATGGLASPAGGPGEAESFARIGVNLPERETSSQREPTAGALGFRPSSRLAAEGAGSAGGASCASGVAVPALRRPIRLGRPFSQAEGDEGGAAAGASGGGAPRYPSPAPSASGSGFFLTPPPIASFKRNSAPYLGEWSGSRAAAAAAAAGRERRSSSLRPPSVRGSSSVYDGADAHSPLLDDGSEPPWSSSCVYSPAMILASAAAGAEPWSQQSCNAATNSATNSAASHAGTHFGNHAPANDFGDAVASGVAADGFGYGFSIPGGDGGGDGDGGAVSAVGGVSGAVGFAAGGGDPALSLGPVRLFVGRVPKTYRSVDLLRLFEPFGRVLESNIIRDRRSAQSRGCGFVRLPSVRAALRAIGALNQARSVAPDLGPLQVKFAAGELERLGLPIALQPGGECVKVFFGNLAPTTSEDDLRDLFLCFGPFEEVCVLRDRARRSKCSGFVTFRAAASARACIASLDGQLVVPGASRPLEVRLAESKMQRGSRRGGFTPAPELPWGPPPAAPAPAAPAAAAGAVGHHRLQMALGGTFQFLHGSGLPTAGLRAAQAPPPPAAPPPAAAAAAVAPAAARGTAARPLPAGFHRLALQATPAPRDPGELAASTPLPPPAPPRATHFAEKHAGTSGQTFAAAAPALATSPLRKRSHQDENELSARLMEHSQMLSHRFAAVHPERHPSISLALTRTGPARSLDGHATHPSPAYLNLFFPGIAADADGEGVAAG